MGKATKATKKFLKNGLEKEKERRKAARPAKQAIAKRKQVQVQRKKDAQARAKDKLENNAGLPKPLPIEEMNVDDFMGKGFANILNGDSSDEDEAGEAAVLQAADEDEDDDDGDEDDDDGDGDGDGDGEDEVEIGAMGSSDGAGAAVDAGDGSGDELSEAEDDGDTAAAQAANGKMADEIGTHKRSLDKLKQEQPEFYKYLQENDSELLSFAEEAEESESDEEGDGSGPAVEGESDDEVDVQGSRGISADSIVRLAGSLKVESKPKAFNAFRKLVAAFKVACPSLDGDGEDDEDEGTTRIKSAHTQGLLIKSSLKRLPEYLDAQLHVPTKPGRAQPLPQAGKQWKKYKGLVKIFVKCVVALLSAPADPETDIFFLQCAVPLCRYFACFPKQGRAFFKLVLSKWSRAADEVRIHAFLVMRQMAIVSPYPFIELCLKGAYLTFVRNCKFPVPSSRPTLTFMLNSVVELYRLDEDATYQHAFIYIRQLAVHLRNATVAKKKDAYLQVYNWQYVYSLRVWCKLLAEELPAGKEGLRPLVYPLVQVALGAMRLVPTARFLPYKFHCIDALITLMEKTGVYVPLSSAILESLDIAEMKRKPRPTTGKPINFDNALKIGKKQLPTPQFQDAVVASVSALSIKYYAAIATSISFPECAYPDSVRIRKYLKACKAKHVVKKLRPLLEKIEENSRYIMAERANVVFSPKDAAKADAWSATLAVQGKSPITRHYKVWLAAELNRQKLRESVQDVKGADYEGEPRPALDDGNDDDNGDDSEEDMMDDGKTLTRMPKKKRKVEAVPDEAAADFNSDDEAEDGEDVIETFAMEDFEFDSD